MTIHSGHPFAEADPDPVRRFRGRIGAAVSLWTAGDGRDRAGLTVTSLMVAGGEPGRVLALLDPDADLTLALEETGRAVVQLLSWPHRQLAEAFAGTAPAPGGPFRTAAFIDTDAGPRLADVAAWADGEARGRPRRGLVAAGDLPPRRGRDRRRRPTPLGAPRGRRRALGSAP